MTDEARIQQAKDIMEAAIREVAALGVTVKRRFGQSHKGALHPDYLPELEYTITDAHS